MTRRGSSVIIGGMLVAAMVLSGVAADEAERTCLKCRIKGFVGAIRAGDVDRSLSYLAEDFKLHSVAGGAPVDRAKMRGVFEWDASLDGKLAYSDLEWDGDTVRGEFTETNELLAMLGMGPQRYRIEFRFEGDLIREQIYEVLESDGPSMDQALEPFLEWARIDHAAELDSIYPGGRFVYTGEAAERWVELLGAWQADGEIAATR